MRLVTAEQMRELDRRTIEEFEVPGEELMERAGHGIAEVVRRISDVAGFPNPRVLLMAGRGNNGGDAFTAARNLKEGGFQVEVWLATAANLVKGDALKHLSRMKAAGIPLRELPTKEDWDDVLIDFPAAAEILVDGLLGTGSNGPARGPAVGAIEYINKNSGESLVVSIDIPSGLDANTGVAAGDAVHADVTVTMGLPKRGLVAPAALEYVGALEVVDIGIPVEYVAELEEAEGPEMVHASDLKKLFGRRSRAAHKGSFGHVVLIGGARGFAGAIALAARAALRSGAGLVSVLTTEGVAPIVAGLVPEAMVTGLPETGHGSLPAALPDAWMEKLNQFDAVLIGPGLTRHDTSAALVESILTTCARPLVIDADALTVLGGRTALLRETGTPKILTPHPGEMASLVGTTAADIQADRLGAAAGMATATGTTVVLKGAGTVVASPGGSCFINLTGNPGMATGGSGDVLAGLLTGLLGQGLPPDQAACAGVYLHGRAGDMLAWRKSQAGVIAGELADELAYAFREVTLR